MGELQAFSSAHNTPRARKTHEGGRLQAERFIWTASQARA